MSAIPPDDYWYDVFISYSRSGVIMPWVINYLHPRLSGWLREELGREVRLFLDEQELSGNEHWPEGIRDRLVHSKCLLPVLSGRYFFSDWCLSEWSNFVSREELLGLRDRKESLIVPALYHDGEKFRREIERYIPFDFRECRSDSPNFENHASYPLFERTVERLAKAVAAVVEQPLDFDPTWPALEFRADRPSIPLMTPA
jgi:hypothetical protein